MRPDHTRACRLARLLTFATFANASVLFAQAPTSSSSPNPPLEAMPRSLETRWELSALPAHLRDSATAYALDPARGYVIARQGTNGMSCIVVRSDWQWDRPFHDDIYWPVCYDVEGSETHLRQYLDAAALRAQGKSAREAHDEIMARFDNGTYRQPSHAGVAYMLAPLMRGYSGTGPSASVETIHLPHYMVYAPNVTDKDIGGKYYGQNPFMLRMSPGHDDVIIFFAGTAEKAQIIAESAPLLAELCAYRSFFCIK
jgi:hypothetical protein